MFTFKVEQADKEPLEIKAITRDVLVWEKAGRGNRSMMGLLRDMHLEDLYWIAHRAASREGVFEGTLSDFEKNCDLDVKDILDLASKVEEDQPDPTQSDQ